MAQLWERLVAPHRCITGSEDRRGARLFAALILVHLGILIPAFVATDLRWRAISHHGVWDDLDTWVGVGSMVLMAIGFALIRMGRYRAGVIVYVLSSAMVPLCAPFVPDPDAEIGVLASATIPLLLAAMAFPVRWVVALIGVVGVVGATQLLLLDRPPRHVGTGWTLLLIAFVTGCLIIVLRRHFHRLEQDRLAQIQEQQDRYGRLFETVTDGIFVADRSGRLLEVNAAACGQLGYERQELLGQSLGDIITRDPEAVRGRMRSVSQGGRVVYETEHRRKDDTLLPVELALTTIELEGEQVFLGVARDLTDRNRAAEERRRLEEQLQLAAKLESIGLLAGGVAHDFNNLLTAIQGNTDMALEELPADHSVVELLKDVGMAAGSAISLTRQLLTFSRRQVVEPRVVDLNDLLRSMLRMLKRLIGEDVELRTELSDDLGAICVDPGVVEQIVVNLVVNARDAMPDGGALTIETRNVTLERRPPDSPSAGEAGPFVMLLVRDTGTGMSEAVRKQVFDPFFTTKPKGRGTGLGLATTYGAVAQSGGDIEVSSELGRGTTFRIHLPRHGEASPEAEPVAEPVARGSGSVLVVEDEKMVRDLAVRVLKRLGYQVLEARDGQEALACAARRSEPIDLLLTDVVMPELNGRQLAERLREEHPETRVLYTSGYPDDIIAPHGVLEPGIDFLPKPYGPSELAARVRQVLDRDEP